MTLNQRRSTWLLALGGGVLLLSLAHSFLTRSNAGGPMGKKGEVGKTSYDQISPVIIGQQSFADMVAKDKANKDKVMARQKALLQKRYDLSVKVDEKVKMTRGKPIPVGPAARLPDGTTWDELGKMSPEEIR